MPGFRCPGCGRGIGGGGQVATVWGCTTCFNRLPIELQRRYRKAILSYGTGTAESAKSLQAEIEEWWKANPSTPAAPEPPAWKRHKQEGQ